VNTTQDNVISATSPLGMTDQADCAGWCKKSLSLPYRLGDLPLFTMSFQGLAYEEHFTQRPLEPPALCRLKQLAVTEVLLLRSQPVTHSLKRLDLDGHHIRYVAHVYRRFCIDLTQSFETYLQHFSAKTRSTFRRKLRKFKNFSGGTIVWREFRAPEDMGAFYQAARAISRKTYQENLFDLGLPCSDRFQRGLIRRASQDLIRAYVLFHKGSPISYLFCTLFDGILLYEYLGYDHSFEKWSPGTLLQYLVLDHLCQSGDYRLFDFGEGEAPHKQFFSTQHTRCADIYYFKRSVRNLLMLSLHAGIDTLSHGIGAGLSLIRAKDCLRKALRKWACT
jgi:CelD/BcsL family acetyltransferase involved in cellulose biosynthesis